MFGLLNKIYNFPEDIRAIIGTNIIIDLLFPAIEILLKNISFPDVHYAKKYITATVEKLLEFGDKFIPNWNYLSTVVHTR